MFKIKIKNPLNEDEFDILTFTCANYEIKTNTISFLDKNNKFFEYPISLFRGAEGVIQ